MTSRKTRILVVDDSAFMRHALTRMVESDPALQVVGTARNGSELLAMARELEPDLITLDVEMPVMDGLTALRQLMTTNPKPVIMVSTLTTAGAEATLQALALGAIDFIPKPGTSPLDVLEVTRDLVAKIKASLRLEPPYPYPRGTGLLVPPPSVASSAPVSVVLIGVSTGGPPVLQAMAEALPADFPVGIVVVQHMPPGFTKSLADRLDRHSALAVKEAENGDPVRGGQLLIAPAGRHLGFRSGTGGPCIELSAETQIRTWHRPSADGMMVSAAKVFGRGCLGIVLTGMGNDGSLGLASIRMAGGRTWAQDEASCLIYGMPRAACEAGVVDRVVPLARLVPELLLAVSGESSAAPSPMHPLASPPSGSGKGTLPGN